MGTLIETRYWQKFGTSYCRLNENLEVLGEWLGVRIELPLVLASSDSVQIKRRLIFNSSKKASSAKLKTVWQLEYSITYDDISIESNRRSFIPADLYTPLDVGVDMDGGSWGSHDWQLEVNAKLLGLDYEAQFNVPFSKPAIVAIKRLPKPSIFSAMSSDSSSDFHAPDDTKVTLFDGGLEFRQIIPTRSIKYVLILGLLFLSSPEITYLNLESSIGFLKPITSFLSVLLLLGWSHARFSQSAVIPIPTSVTRKYRIIFFNRKKDSHQRSLDKKRSGPVRRRVPPRRHHIDAQPRPNNLPKSPCTMAKTTNRRLPPKLHQT